MRRKRRAGGQFLVAAEASCSALGSGRRRGWRAGTMLFMTSSGFATPNDEMPMPLLPVPYAAPMLAKMRAKAAPMNPKNGAFLSNCPASSAVTMVWAEEGQRGQEGHASDGRPAPRGEGDMRWGREGERKFVCTESLGRGATRDDCRQAGSAPELRRVRALAENSNAAEADVPEPSSRTSTARAACGCTETPPAGGRRRRATAPIRAVTYRG